MATAKKLEFQAERKAAAWQSGKPQPAPLPADVHAATCLIDSDGEAARTAYPVFPGIEIAYHDVHAASAATQRACAAGCLEIHHCREGRIAYPYGDACFFSRRAIWRSCSARQKQSRCAFRPGTTTASR